MNRAARATPPLEEIGRLSDGTFTVSGQLRAAWLEEFGHEDMLDLALIEFSDRIDADTPIDRKLAARMFQVLDRIHTRVTVWEPEWVLKLMRRRGALLYELTPAFRPWPYWMQHLRATGKHGQAMRAEAEGVLIVPSYWPWVMGPTVIGTDDGKHGEGP